MSIQEWAGTKDQEGTSEMLKDNVLTFTEVVIPITDLSNGGLVTTIKIKLGLSTEKQINTQLNHLKTELNSNSSQECLHTEQSSGLSILEVTNTD